MTEGDHDYTCLHRRILRDRSTPSRSAMRRYRRPACLSIVGLPDKAVSEARDRVRTALSNMTIAMPSKRVAINLSPANLPKVG